MRSHEQGVHIWPRLVARTINATTPDAAKITYGDLALAIYGTKRAGRALRRALGLIGRWCDHQDLPALNCLVDNQKTMECGQGAVTTGGLSPQQERTRAVNFDWHTVQPPTAAQLKAADRPELHIP
jgi:hypothetical protein